MHVVATAGHVDHGKSTLVRALTGMEPDRWAEERRRGMTIDLGFAWTMLPSGERLAFVDVPGHERFVPNMLAGVGPAPAVLFVVAADEGWMPQSAEHLAALDALGVEQGLLAITRADLADPHPARQQAVAEIAGSSLGDVPAVVVSGVTGLGLDALRDALDRLVSDLPAPDPSAPVRLWVDRAFTIRGSGRVVTGTLTGGALTTGDKLVVAGSAQPVRVRALQALGESADRVEAVARVAVNVRGAAADRVERGDALLTPGRFFDTSVVDVRLRGDPVATLPATVTLHIGSAAVPARVRPLGVDTARLSLARALPLRIGDRALLRDPGRRHVAGGLTVLDVRPPPLARRGAAAARAGVLAGMSGHPDEANELRRRSVLRRSELVAMGVPSRAAPVTGEWLADPTYWADLGARLKALVTAHGESHPLETGMPVDVARQRLGLPDRELVTALVHPPLTLRDGRVVDERSAAQLPAQVAGAVDEVRRELAAAPFAAPEAGRLAQLGLGPREISAAARAGSLLRLAEGVVLLPGAEVDAARVLADLPQPFTLSEARQALATTRRVAVPLLELLDRKGVTRRLPDDRRVVRPP
jgi:selenocysteine-specific elongation factor